MKTVKNLALSIIVGANSYGQTLEEAIKKTDNERYAAASSDFKMIISKNPSNADNYFYYGENFFKNEEIDSANMMWQKGNSIDPLNPLNIVGLGKFQWFSNDTIKAREHFNQALKLTKNKNAEVIRQISEVFIYSKNKRLDEAIDILNQAIKIDSKNPETYLVLGDALLEKTPRDGSPAILNYNKALELNPKSSKGLVRTAKLYQRARNYELADSKYKEAQTLDPTYAPAFRENAELNMMFNQSSKAIENWKKYLALNNSVEARYRYATSLFTGKKYCETIDELKSVQSAGFNNYYVERMMMYSYYECAGEDQKANAELGIKFSNDFFKMIPENKIIPSDYKYLGLLYSKLGKDSLAITKFEYAAKKDTSLIKEMYGEIASIYVKQKNYAKTIEAYTIKMNGNYNNLEVAEYYDLGKAYFFGPKDYALADTFFRILSEKSSTFSIAYFWQGRCKYKKESPEQKWLAKDSFQKFISMLSEDDLKNPSYKSFAMEACKYLGDYYINSPEYSKEEAKKYWTIVQQLEPADKQADAFFKSPHAK